VLYRQAGSNEARLDPPDVVSLVPYKINMSLCDYVTYLTVGKWKIFRSQEIGM